MKTDIGGTKAAVVSEGFLYGTANEKAISEVVLTTIEQLKQLGMTFETISMVDELKEAKGLTSVLSIFEFYKVTKEGTQPYRGRLCYLEEVKRSFNNIHNNLTSDGKMACLFAEWYVNGNRNEDNFLLEKCLNRVKNITE